MIIILRIKKRKKECIVKKVQVTLTYSAWDVEGKYLVKDDCSIYQCQHNVAQIYKGWYYHA